MASVSQMASIVISVSFASCLTACTFPWSNSTDGRPVPRQLQLPLSSPRHVHASQTCDHRQLRAKTGVPSGAQSAPLQIGLATRYQNAGGQTVENAGDFSGGTTFVRSWINRRSNWARAEKILKINSPDAVVVSIAPSWSDRNPTPRSLRPSTTVIRCRIDLPRRSSRHATSVSPVCNVARHFASPGRSHRAPDSLSLKIWELGIPWLESASS